MAKRPKKKKKGKKKALPKGYDRFIFDQDIHAFFEQSKNIQLLTLEEEKTLLRQAAAGDQDAVQKLVYHNLKFIIQKAKSLVKNHQSTSRPSNSLFLEAISEGCLGLVRAIEEFDPGKECKLITYGAWHIEDYIRKAILFEVNSSRPAKALSQVKNSKTNLVPISAFEEFDHEDFTTESVIDLIDQAVTNEQLKEAIKTLQPLERIIVCHRYGFFDRDYTYTDLAKILDLTTEKIRKIENNALRKLYIELNGNRLNQFDSGKEGPEGPENPMKTKQIEPVTEHVLEYVTG